MSTLTVYPANEAGLSSAAVTHQPDWPRLRNAPWEAEDASPPPLLLIASDAALV